MSLPYRIFCRFEAFCFIFLCPRFSNFQTWNGRIGDCFPPFSPKQSRKASAAAISRTPTLYRDIEKEKVKGKGRREYIFHSRGLLFFFPPRNTKHRSDDSTQRFSDSLKSSSSRKIKVQKIRTRTESFFIYRGLELSRPSILKHQISVSLHFQRRKYQMETFAGARNRLVEDLNLSVLPGKC